MRTRPPRRTSAAIWAVSLAGAGCLALTPVARAGAAAAPNPPQRNGHVQQQPPQQGQQGQQGQQNQNQQQNQNPQHQNQNPNQNQQPPRQQPSNQQRPPRSGGNDPHSWHNWDNNWRDGNFRSSHSVDSRHERVDDRAHNRFDDRFHTDDFRGHFGDRDFRTDCDELHGFSTVRALLDFLDGHPAIRDFFEDHGDLFDFLVHHSDMGEDFDADCTFIDVF